MMKAKTGWFIPSIGSTWVLVSGAGVFANSAPNDGQQGSQAIAPAADQTAFQPGLLQDKLAAQVAADHALCQSLCATFSARVQSAQVLDAMAENFFILWNLIGKDREFGALELQARSTAPKPVDTDDSLPSLDEIVQKWAQARFGSRGVETLLLAVGPASPDFQPAYRSGLYLQTGVADSACPFGELGALGLQVCPRCLANGSLGPSERSSLTSCASAYAHNGDTLLGNIMGSGRYQRQLQANYCQAEDLFKDADEWRAAVAPEVQSQASGSLVAIYMFQSAIEGDVPQVDPNFSASAKQVFRDWLPYFGAPLQKAPPDALSDLDSCTD